MFTVPMTRRRPRGASWQNRRILPPKVVQPLFTLPTAPTPTHTRPAKLHFFHIFCFKGKMGRRTKEELRAEFARLMQAHTEAMKTETFGGLNAQQVREQEERLGRIREVSADFLVALKGDAASSIS